MGLIYLDNAATTKPKEEVLGAMLPYFYDKWYNPSSLYAPTKEIRKDVFVARRKVAKKINAKASEIYFTSGGSESNNWAIQGFHNMYPESPIITTTIEHKSIMDCVTDMGNVHFVGVDKQGRVNLEQLEQLLQYIGTRPILVSIQYANNEIGTIQDIKKVSEIVHKYNGILHTDAVQAFGHIPIDVIEQGIDLLSASGHKIGCPKGIGFLYKKNEIKIKPLIYGSQEHGMRGGTENVPGIIGLGKAVELLSSSTPILVEKHRKIMEEELLKMGCIINGSEHKLPNNINVTIPLCITGEALIHVLSMYNICISSGSACNSHSKTSHVLQEIGLSDDEISKTVRITLPDDIDGTKVNIVVDKILEQFQITKSLFEKKGSVVYV